MDTNWGLDHFVVIIGGIFFLWMLIRYIRRNPEELSSENLSKGAYTMGLLALALIALVAFGIFVLNS